MGGLFSYRLRLLALKWTSVAIYDLGGNAYPILISGARGTYYGPVNREDGTRHLLALIRSIRVRHSQQSNENVLTLGICLQIELR